MPATFSAATSEAATSLTSVPMCIQGELNVAIEQGGGLQTKTPLGYTFLIVNIANRACSIQGFPWWIVFSRVGGVPTKVKITHHPNSLYAQPLARKVVLGVRSVASFGISYMYQRSPTFTANLNCQATTLDFRLPAKAAHLFSFSFPVHIDVCATNREIDVTPVEARTSPLA
jgi:hypothetical protein